MTLATVLVILGIGTLAGLVGALFGIGGGILVIPALVIGFGVPMHTAIVTSLLCVIATSSAAASRNIKTGFANVRLAMALEPFTVAGAIAGGVVAGLIPGTTLMEIFALTIIAMSLPMARGVPDEDDSAPDVPEVPETRLTLRGSYFDPSTRSEVAYDAERVPALMGVSALAGVLSGLLGVGGGIVQVPAMTIMGKIPMKAATATSNMMIGVTAVASAIIYYGRGDILPEIAAASVSGVFVGSRLGVHLGSRIRGRTLRRAFAVVMVAIGVQLLLKAHGLWFR